MGSVATRMSRSPSERASIAVGRRRHRQSGVATRMRWAHAAQQRRSRGEGSITSRPAARRQRRVLSLSVCPHCAGWRARSAAQRQAP
eukprot:scaffold330133_cov67-Tisochrysis_lutea.AAC.2